MSTQTLIPEYDNETIKPPSKLVYEHEETLQRLLKRACTEYPIEHNQFFFIFYFFFSKNYCIFYHFFNSN